MATTDYELESIFSENHPHTSNAIQKLLMAMADVYNHRGKRSFFGHDKGLKSYEKFHKRLKELINWNYLVIVLWQGNCSRQNMQ